MLVGRDIHISSPVSSTWCIDYTAFSLTEFPIRAHQHDVCRRLHYTGVCAADPVKKHRKARVDAAHAKGCRNTFVRRKYAANAVQESQPPKCGSALVPVRGNCGNDENRLPASAFEGETAHLRFGGSSEGHHCCVPCARSSGATVILPPAEIHVCAPQIHLQIQI